MGITDLITGGIGAKAIAGLSKTLGISESKAKWVVAAAVPLMIAALKYNAKNKNQDESINKALDQHAGGGGLLDSIGSLFSGAPSEDGNKIVQHIFGKNTESVTQNLADKSGIDSNQIGSILATLGPLVMGYLGQQKQSSSSSGGGIGDLIGSVLGGAASKSTDNGGGIGSIIGSIFGSNNNSEQQAPDQPAAQGSGLEDMLGNLAGEFFNKKNDNSTKGSVLDSLVGMFGK